MDIDDVDALRRELKELLICAVVLLRPFFVDQLAFSGAVWDAVRTRRMRACALCVRVWSTTSSMLMCQEAEAELEFKDLELRCCYPGHQNLIPE